MLLSKCYVVEVVLGYSIHIHPWHSHVFILPDCVKECSKDWKTLFFSCSMLLLLELLVV